MSNTLLTPEENARVAELREIYQEPPLELRQQWGPEDPYGQGPSVRFLLRLLDKQLESRQYAREVIAGMELEARAASEIITELRQQIQEGAAYCEQLSRENQRLTSQPIQVTMTPGYQQVWVDNPTTGGGYWTTISQAGTPANPLPSSSSNGTPS